MLSITISPLFFVRVVIVILIVFSLCYLFKDQILEVMIKIRKTNILHSKLKRFCKNHDYILLTNLILPTNDGKRIKIDDLIIADKYIYIISQRILYGNISGVETDSKWIVRTKNDAKYFSNPFNANQIRLETVANLVNISLDNFINLICFSKTAFIKDVSLNKNNRILTNVDNIENQIIKKEKNSIYNDFLPEEIEKTAAFLYQKSKESLIK